MLIIDIHGHQTLVPKAHLDFREKQMARLADPSLPRPDLPEYTDDELREIIENNQLKLQRERGADMTIFSPRASRMGETSVDWAHACNNMIKRVCDLFPDNFVGVCQLPQQIIGTSLDLVMSACMRRVHITWRRIPTPL